MDFSFIMTGILGITIIVFIYLVKKGSTNYWGKLGIPYFVSSPLASIKDALLPKKPVADSIIDMYRKLESEKYAGGYNFFTPALMLRDLDLINQILVKDFSYFEDREKPDDERDLFSSSLFNQTGDKWRHARHKLTPTFTSGKLKRMFFLMKECSDETVNYLKEKQSEDMEGKVFMSKVVLNIIGKVAFGLNIDSFSENSDKNNEFIKYSREFLKPNLSFVLKTMWNRAMPFFKLKVANEKAETFFRNLTTDLVKYRESSGERRNDFLQIMLDEKKNEKNFSSDKSKNVSLNPNDAVEPEDKELLDQLENMQKSSKYDYTPSNEIFTNEFMAAQSFTFIFGGSESTANALTFLMYELAMNKDAQIKLQNEISNVLHTNDFSYEAVSKMTYLEQCINETFRLHPFLPILIRMCTKDYQILGTEVKLYKGMLIMVPVVALHYDSQYFKEPEKFDPDRFEDMKCIPRGSFLPFGGGPRFCIAMRLAILQMKVFLATLLFNYSVELSEKTKLPLKYKKYSFFAEVEGGIWLKFKKREDRKIE